MLLMIVSSQTERIRDEHKMYRDWFVCMCSQIIVTSVYICEIKSVPIATYAMIRAGAHGAASLALAGPLFNSIVVIFAVCKVAI